MFNGNPVGLFTTLIQPTDAFYAYAGEMCTDYYTRRSGEKPLSAQYDQIIYLKADLQSDVVPEEILADIARSKFLDRWAKYFSALTIATNPLTEYSEDIAITDVTTNTKTYNVSEINDGNEGTNIKRTNSYEDNTDVYGFNSETSVPTGKDNGNSTDTTTGTATDNTTHNDFSKTGTEGDQGTHDITRNKQGRNNSEATLIDREIKLREKYNFFELVFRDLDTLVVGEVY